MWTRVMSVHLFLSFSLIPINHLLEDHRTRIGITGRLRPSGVSLQINNVNVLKAPKVDHPSINLFSLNVPPASPCQDRSRPTDLVRPGSGTAYARPCNVAHADAHAGLMLACAAWSSPLSDAYDVPTVSRFRGYRGPQAKALWAREFFRGGTEKLGDVPCLREESRRVELRYSDITDELLRYSDSSENGSTAPYRGYTYFSASARSSLTTTEATKSCLLITAGSFTASQRSARASNSPRIRPTV